MTVKMHNQRISFRTISPVNIASGNITPLIAAINIPMIRQFLLSNIIFIALLLASPSSFAYINKAQKNTISKRYLKKPVKAKSAWQRKRKSKASKAKLSTLRKTLRFVSTPQTTLSMRYPRLHSAAVLVVNERNGQPIFEKNNCNEISKLSLPRSYEFRAICHPPTLLPQHIKNILLNRDFTEN